MTDPTLKRYFDLPPEVDGRKLDEMCANQALSFIASFEPKLLIPREECAYGLPWLPEEQKR